MNSTSQAALRAVDQLRTNLNATLLGKIDVVELAIACLLARGHILFDDLPGLGKTTLAKAMAQSIGGIYSRVQCTPDLLPSDITGFNLLNAKTREFEFRRGPIFADILLADEINRATPRTQSALFEAMAERQATIDGQTYSLSPTFMVIATQNPIESHGAYPLPEAQLDRFAMKLHIGYPDREHELAMLEAAISDSDTPTKIVPPCFNEVALRDVQNLISAIPVEPIVQRYLLDIVECTREHPSISLGVSPRGVLLWQRVAQACAFLKHRRFVTPDDILQAAAPVLGVRIAGDFESPESIMTDILSQVSVPA